MKKKSRYWWSFSRLVFHGLPPLEIQTVLPTSPNRTWKQSKAYSSCTQTRCVSFPWPWGSQEKFSENWHVSVFKPYAKPYSDSGWQAIPGRKRNVWLTAANFETQTASTRRDSRIASPTRLPKKVVKPVFLSNTTTICPRNYYGTILFSISLDVKLRYGARN